MPGYFLNLSVECFFKHLYGLLKPKFAEKQAPTKRFPLGPVEYDGGFLFYLEVKKGEKLPAPSQFGHEVRVLYELIDLFTNANEDSSFKELKHQIPTQAEWIKTRYSVQNNEAKKDKFEIYLKNFEETLETIFRNVK